MGNGRKTLERTYLERHQAEALVVGLELHLGLKIPNISPDNYRGKLIRDFELTRLPTRKKLLVDITRGSREIRREKFVIIDGEDEREKNHLYVVKFLNNNPESHKLARETGVGRGRLRDILGKSTRKYLVSIVDDEEILRAMETSMGTDGAVAFEGQVMDAMTGDFEDEPVSILGRITTQTETKKGLYLMRKPVLLVPRWPQARKFLDWETSSAVFYRRNAAGIDVRVEKGEYEMCIANSRGIFLQGQVLEKFRGERTAVIIYGENRYELLENAYQDGDISGITHDRTPKLEVVRAYRGVCEEAVREIRRTLITPRMGDNPIGNIDIKILDPQFLER